MIILTADHGAELNWEKHSKYSLYDERIRVPLIVKYPNWFDGSKSKNEFVNTNTEIHKIIYRSLELPLPKHLIDLSEYKLNESIIYSETIYNPNQDPRAHSIALITDNYKLVNFNRINLKSFEYEKTMDSLFF